MDSVKKLALDRGIAFLKAANVKAYFIFDEDDELHSENNGAVDARRRIPNGGGKRRRSIHPVRDFAKAIGYVEPLRALQPGESYTWTRADHEICTTHAAWTSFTASVYSMAKQTWGKDSFILERTPTNATLLRVI